MIVNMNCEYNDINQDTKCVGKTPYLLGQDISLKNKVSQNKMSQEQHVCLGKVESGTEHSWNSGESAKC